MIDPDIAIGRAIADDFDISGPQFSVLTAYLRRVAAKLEAFNATPSPCPSPAPAGPCVIDGDDIPGVRCLNCED